MAFFTVTAMKTSNEEFVKNVIFRDVAACGPACVVPSLLILFTLMMKVV
jgi:hypothetical protein